MGKIQISMNCKCINKMQYVYAMEHYLVIKKNLKY